MPMCFSDFLFRLSSEPALAITVGLLLAVMLVNGWTDAPNAIAAAVSTGAERLFWQRCAICWA